MKKRELLKLEPAAPEKEEGIYALSILQLLPDDKVVCEIDIYDGEELLARYFADAETGKRISYYVIYDKWYGTKFENVVADVTQQKRTSYWTYAADIEWSSKEHKERVLDYLDTYSINAWESKHDRKERWKAADRKAARIEKEVDEFGLIPDEVENWVKEKLIPEEVIFIHRTKTATEWFCTACGGRGETKDALKIGKLQKCPKCGHEVRGKKAGVPVFKSVPVIVLQTNEDRTKYCEKQLKAVVTWDDDGKNIEMRISVIAIMNRGCDFGKLYYGQALGADETMQSWWTRNTGSHFRRSWVYPYNLDEIIGPMMDAERTGIEQIIKDRPININNYLYSGWIRNPKMEYMIKRGLFRLAQEFMECCEISTNKEELLGYLRGNKEAANRLKKLDGGMVMLEWIYDRDNQGLRDEDLVYMQEIGIYPDFSVAERLSDRTLQKICNYLRKNRANNQFIMEWNDYLSMAAREGMDISDDIVAFPKNMKERHDELVRRIAERKDIERAKEYENIDRKIFENLPKALPWKWSDERYTIIPAVCCADLMRESRELHHCVGTSTTYMDKMAAGRTWIFFLRESSEQEKPYYTIELDMNSGKTLQWYSAYDRKPDEKTIKEVIDRWLLEKNRERKAG